MAGAVVRSVPLRFDTDEHCFTLNVSELAMALTDKTKLLVLNNPHNPW